jgi:hypothetical protein
LNATIAFSTSPKVLSKSSFSPKSYFVDNIQLKLDVTNKQDNAQKIRWTTFLDWIRITDVGRLVHAAAPRSCFDGTYTYGTFFSSQKMGTCDITSIGEMSPAITQIPVSFWGQIRDEKKKI